MIMSPSSVQTQLGDAISVIADSDFWERWDTLIEVRSKKVDYFQEQGTNQHAPCIGSR